MNHFWPINQHLNFSQNLFIICFEIIPDESYQKVGKCDNFGFLRKDLVIPKMG